MTPSSELLQTATLKQQEKKQRQAAAAAAAAADDARSEREKTMVCGAHGGLRLGAEKGGREGGGEEAKVSREERGFMGGGQRRLR